MRHILGNDNNDNNDNNNNDKDCDNNINNNININNISDPDDDMVYHLLVQTMMKNMEKCKLYILSDIISMLIVINDSNNDTNNENKMMLLLFLRVSISLCNGCLNMPSLLIDRVLDVTIASEIIETKSGNSDSAISFRVLMKLIRNKWSYRNNDTNRISWREVKSNKVSNYYFLLFYYHYHHHHHHCNYAS